MQTKGKLDHIPFFTEVFTMKRDLVFLNFEVSPAFCFFKSLQTAIEKL